MTRTPPWSVGLGSALALLLALGCAPATSGPAAPAAGQGPAPAPVGAAREPADSGGAPLAPELQALVDAARRERALNLVWTDGALGSSEGVRSNSGRRRARP